MPKGKFIELMDDMHLSNSELFQNYYNNVASRNISGANQIIENNDQLQNQITDSDNVNQLIERVNSNEQQIKTDVDEYLQDQLNAFQDLINQTKNEMKLIEKYMPKQMSKEELEETVEETIKEVGASSKKDFGKVMQALMPKIKGKADGKAASSIVGKKLN